MTEKLNEANDKTKNKKPSLEEAASAVRIVNIAIAELETKYQAIATEESELEPIMLEGETNKGFPCQLMVDPKIVAKVFLKYDFATRKILMQDSCTEMWQELAEIVGLEDVSFVEL